jgi:hypothetical protein
MWLARAGSRAEQVALCGIAVRDDLTDPTDQDFGLRAFVGHLTTSGMMSVRGAGECL